MRNLGEDWEEEGSDSSRPWDGRPGRRSPEMKGDGGVRLMEKNSVVQLRGGREIVNGAKWERRNG